MGYMKLRYHIQNLISISLLCGACLLLFQTIECNYQGYVCEAEINSKHYIVCRDINKDILKAAEYIAPFPAVLFIYLCLYKLYKGIPLAGLLEAIEKTNMRKSN